MVKIDLQDKVAVVTGAGRGIGKAIAQSLAQAGAKLALIARTQSQLEGVAQELRDKYSAQVAVFPVDLGDEAQIEPLFEEIYSQFGKIDILVNNAGITRDGLLMRMKDDDWDTVLNLNLRSIFLMVRTVSKRMLKARAGKIINISSVVGILGNPGQANYCAAKAGLIGFSKSVAKELASRGITVNVVAPGFIETDMTEKMSDKAKEAILSQVPLNRHGQPQDVAQAVLFLASPLADYLTGQVLCVDGGMAM